MSVDVCLGHDNWGCLSLGKAEWVHMGNGLRAVLCCALYRPSCVRDGKTVVPSSLDLETFRNRILEERQGFRES